MYMHVSSGDKMEGITVFVKKMQPFAMFVRIR